VLQARFGALPKNVERRIDAVDADELEQLLTRAVDIKSIDAF